MRIFLATIALAMALPLAVQAQLQASLPICFENADATSSTSFPFSTTSDHTWQWHYANRNFATCTAPIVITDISLRPLSATSTIGAFDFPSVEVVMATATTGYQVGQHDPVFANNLGTDQTIVRTGPWVGGPVGPAPAGAAAGTWFSMGLQVPFVFDPTTGSDLIIQIRKCGTNVAFLGAIDGATGGVGAVGGNRYGDTSNCSATSSTFNNNEFVPVVLLDYATSGTPMVCVSEYQQNQPTASMTLNGLPDPGGNAPIFVAIPLPAPVTTATLPLN